MRVCTSYTYTHLSENVFMYMRSKYTFEVGGFTRVVTLGLNKLCAHYFVISVFLFTWALTISPVVNQHTKTHTVARSECVPIFLEKDQTSLQKAVYSLFNKFYRFL